MLCSQKNVWFLLPQFKRNQISKSNMGLTHAIYCENFFPSILHTYHIRYKYCYLTTDGNVRTGNFGFFFWKFINFVVLNVWKCNLLTGKRKSFAKIRNGYIFWPPFDTDTQYICSHKSLWLWMKLTIQFMVTFWIVGLLRCWWNMQILN